MTPARLPRDAAAVGWGERQRHLVDVDRRLAAALPTSRRVAVVALGGGAGATTVAAATALLATDRRGAPVLAVDAQGDPQGLPARLGWTDVAPAPGGLGDLRIDAFAEASALLPRRESLHLLALGRAERTTWPAEVDDWRRAVLPVGRFFPLVVTDWGRRPDLDALAAIARASHALCLVVDADRVALETAAALVPAVRRLPTAPDVTLALVDIRRRGAAATRIDVGGLDAAVLRVPFDARLAHGLAPHRRTRRALAALAAELVSPALRRAA